MDISTLKSAYDHYAIPEEGLTIHYRRPSTPEIVDAEVRASEYLSIESDFDRQKSAILERCLEELGLDRRALVEMGDDELKKFNAKYVPMLLDEDISISLDSRDQLDPVIDFIISAIVDVDGLTEGNVIVPWETLEASTHRAVIEALTADHIRNMFFIIRSSTALPTKKKTPSEDTSK